jgi:predicted N-acetyltransferase YhbS
LLAQLGVDVSCQGRGLGRELVLHAMGQAVKVAALAGCRLFIVHPATAGLEGYYEKFGFIGVEATPGRVMAMSLQRVRATLAAV